MYQTLAPLGSNTRLSSLATTAPLQSSLKENTVPSQDGKRCIHIALWFTYAIRRSCRNVKDPQDLSQRFFKGSLNTHTLINAAASLLAQKQPCSALSMQNIRAAKTLSYNFDRITPLIGTSLPAPSPFPHQTSTHSHLQPLQAIPLPFST